jgi:hypothetical protein
MPAFKKWPLLLALLILPLAGCFTNHNKAADAASPTPTVVYLTWQHSPSTTMVVHWITPSPQTNDALSYQEKGSTTWKDVTAAHQELPESHNEFLIHTAELSNLRPNTVYTFRLNNNPTPYTFLTAPDRLTEPLTFADGGDIYHDSMESVREISRLAAKHNPLFVVLGGDIAYSAKKDASIPEKLHRWLDFLQAYQQDMVTSDGRLIPLLPVMGNTDVKGHFNQIPANAPLFYALFATSDKQGYTVLDFGDYLSLWLLDTQHTHPITGTQTEFLKKTLAERQNTLHKFASYHVPAYPAYRPFDLKWSADIREHWVPLFEQYHLNAAFEHHDHTFKRTHPIKNNQIDPTGVIYLGDGAWGVSKPRKPDAERWYINKALPERHIFLITLTPTSRTFQAINHEGKVFDSFTQEK